MLADIGTRVDGWPHFPVIQGGWLSQPLDFDPPTFIETPDYQRMGHVTHGSRYLWRRFGIPFPSAVVDTDFAASTAKLVNPEGDPERIRYFDEMRCLSIDPRVLATTGTAFELVRVHVQRYGAGVVERLGTIFGDVTALDDDGEPLFSFGPLSGFRPCIFPLPHPDPQAGVLAVQFRLVVTGVPASSKGPTAGFPPYQGPIPVAAIPADQNMRPPWSDLRQGYLVRWADLLQYVTSQNALIRLFGVYFAQPNRWRLGVGGRISGYWNSTGPLGVARDNATQRTV
jgi:hypothetical protein